MPDSTQINWAEIADKALDLGQQATLSIVEKIEQSAPKAWELLMRQVYIEAVMSIVTPLVCFLITSIIVYFIIRIMRKNNCGWEDCSFIPVYIIGGVSTIVPFVAFLIGVHDGVQIMYNPEYYALQKLFTLAGV